MNEQEHIIRIKQDGVVQSDGGTSNWAARELFKEVTSALESK